MAEGSRPTLRSRPPSRHLLSADGKYRPPGPLRCKGGLVAHADTRTFDRGGILGGAAAHSARSNDYETRTRP